MLLVVCLGLCLGLAGCAGNDPGSGRDEIEEDDEDEDDEDDEDEDGDDDLKEPEEAAVRVIDHGSAESLLSFIEGAWHLTDKNTGTVYGEMQFDAGGKCEFTSLVNGSSCEGSISFTEGYNENMSGLHCYELSLEGLLDFGCGIDEDVSAGNFLISQTDGGDFLYLEEIGNGGSAIFYDVFMSPDAGDYSFDMQWLFVRENDVNVAAEPEKNATFYAIAIENGDQSILLQRMDAVAFERIREYAPFRYMAARFDESAYSEAAWYTFTEDADLGGVLNKTMLHAPFPSTIYEVTTGSDGSITSLSEVERAYYGEYELYPLEQEVSFNGTTFTVNGYDLKLEDYGIEGGPITDCEVFGDYAILESHINPHMGLITIFNIRTGWPEKEMYGCNFIHGDRIWDSFYTYMDTVYDYAGNEVFTVDGTEISSISFTDTELGIKVEYWKADYEETNTQVIERPEVLNAPIYAFMDYRHHTCGETWQEFMSYAPQGALVMVMVNPYPDESWDYYQPTPVEGEYGLDLVYVISLADGTTVSFGPGTEAVLDRGAFTSYSLTVSEGVPMYTLTAQAQDGRSADWPAVIISGRDDIRWTFR